MKRAEKQVRLWLEEGVADALMALPSDERSGAIARGLAGGGDAPDAAPVEVAPALPTTVALTPEEVDAIKKAQVYVIYGEISGAVKHSWKLGDSTDVVAGLNRLLERLGGETR